MNGFIFLPPLGLRFGSATEPVSLLQSMASFVYVYGLGGRDIQTEHFKDVAAKIERIAESGKVDEMLGYINLRE